MMKASHIVVALMVAGVFLVQVEANRALLQRGRRFGGRFDGELTFPTSRNREPSEDELEALRRVPSCLYEPCENQGDEYPTPPLPYAYDALETTISTQTNEYHHDRHFMGYITKMNTALQSLEGTRWSWLTNLQPERIMLLLEWLPDRGLPEDFKTNFRRNGGGYINHKMYFQIMGPEGSQRTPTQGSSLEEAINAAFGSFENMREELTTAATSQFGSGWGFLVSDRDGDLSVVATANQNSPYLDGFFPIMGLDVWEHAYYLTWGPSRGDYTNLWWDLLNFETIEAAYEKLTS